MFVCLYRLGILGVTSVLTISMDIRSCQGECVSPVTAPTTGTAQQKATVTPTLGSVSSVSSTLRAPNVRGVLRDTLEMLLTASAVSAPVMFWALILRGLYWLKVC